MLTSLTVSGGYDGKPGTAHVTRRGYGAGPASVKRASCAQNVEGTKIHPAPIVVAP